MNAPKILIIEDDDLQYEIYEEALAKYQLTRASNGSEALTRISRDRPDVLILDHVLSEGELGLDFLSEFKELLPFVPVTVSYTHLPSPRDRTRSRMPSSA